MRLRTWITVAKRSSVWAAVLSLPLAPAYAQEHPAQPAAAQAPKPAKAQAKPVAAASSAPAANGGATASVSDKAEPKKAKTAGKAPKANKAKPAEPAAPAAPAVQQPAPEQLAQVQPPLRLKSSEAPQPSAAGGPICSLAEPEQPRGGRLDVLGDRFGSAPVVRIAGRPARQLERRADRISVQIPADSDGGPITLQNDGKALACGNLVIIGKNR